MTMFPPAKGGTGVKCNCSCAKTRRTAHVEMTDNETGVPREQFLPPHTLMFSVSRVPYKRLQSHTPSAWATLGMSLKGMIQAHNKGKETQCFTPSPQGSRARLQL